MNGGGLTTSHDVYPVGRTVVREVGLRDGLQLVKQYPTTAAKIAWIDREYQAGVRHFEVGSFLPVSRMPQFADVREVIAKVSSLPGAHGIALVLNERGARDALETAVDEITVVISATDEHNQANARRSRAQSLAEIANTVAMRDQSDRRPLINVGIAMALGCSLSGDVDPDDVVAIVDQCMEAGVDMVGLADTVGYAGPRQVADLCRRLTRKLGDMPYMIHLHDTRGMGIANASAALDEGARIFDASLGGLGGCPFAPGATGNIVLEDLVYLLETKGFRTGIDLEGIISTRSILENEMPNERLHGKLALAGPPRTYEWRTGKAHA